MKPDRSHSKQQKAAYGGENWSPRIAQHRDEIPRSKASPSGTGDGIGTLWARCGLSSEWGALKQVLLHPPGPELAQTAHPEDAQLLEIPDWELACQQHATIAQTYRDAGVSVHYVEPDTPPSPNLIFCADLFWMTPEGAILARPASTVRAGEERFIARRLADLGIPILRTLTGTATFEGADALWIDDRTALIGRGLRTNIEGIRQITTTLNEIGVEAIPVDLPIGTMHLMGILRILDHDLAICWPYRLAWSAVEALQERGFRVGFIPDASSQCPYGKMEAAQSGALNFVTLGARQILMAAGNPKTQAFLESEGVTCHSVEVDELLKAAGGIGCLTGIIERA